jgi:parallel beta-helix repeat protein
MITPEDGMHITQDTTFEPGVYLLSEGITIAADGICLEGRGAVLVGCSTVGNGVTLSHQQNVTIRNLQILNYQHGIFAQDCKNLVIDGCRVSATAEVPANTIFLDIWKSLKEAYGGGILLANVTESQVTGCSLQHQMCGLLAYGCRRLLVKDNNASYCSGFGFHLYNTCSSLYQGNTADFCCRYQPRGERHGHMGADAAGFLIVHNSCENTFRRNQARLGGDGFFLAGLTSALEPVPCNNNFFEENDGSYSPNIAFEATFSQGNIYRGNQAYACNYGFWLGFSRDGVLEDNQVSGCRQAGIAVENGIHFQVRNNTFQDNGCGILLWSKHIPDFIAAVPENDTSRDWLIEANTFTHNQCAVRIAANQDHGIRPYPVPEGQDPAIFRRPHHHRIRHNLIQNNRIGIQVVNSDQTVIEENQYTGNLEGDIL